MEDNFAPPRVTSNTFLLIKLYDPHMEVWIGYIACSQMHERIVFNSKNPDAQTDRDGREKNSAAWETLIKLRQSVLIITTESTQDVFKAEDPRIDLIDPEALAEIENGLWTCKQLRDLEFAIWYTAKNCV